MRSLSAILAIGIVSVAHASQYSNVNGDAVLREGVVYTVQGDEGSPNALLYREYPEGDKLPPFSMESALIALGYSYTYVSDPFAYEGQLQKADWDLVMQGHYLTLGTGPGFSQPFEDEIADYIAGGGRAVIHDWRTGRTYDGVTVATPYNYESVMPIAGSRFHEHFGSTESISLGQWWIQWGVFSTSLVGGTGEPQLLSGFGTVAGQIGDGGNTYIDGLVDDTIGPGFFDLALATDVYVSMILSIPEPGTFLLMVAGAGVLVRRRSRVG